LLSAVPENSMHDAFGDTTPLVAMIASFDTE